MTLPHYNLNLCSYLGQACAQNEDESAALAALHKCISLDPYNLSALMQLGVSHANEYNEAKSLKYLHTWMAHNPEYMGTVDTSGTSSSLTILLTFRHCRTLGLYCI